MSLASQIEALATRVATEFNAIRTSLSSKANASHTHVATTDLTATGTKSSSTYLRGDDTWATVFDGIGEQVNITDLPNQNMARVDVIADGTNSGSWPDRFAFYFTPVAGSATRAGYFNEYGEMRARAAITNTVALRAMGHASAAASQPVFEVTNSSQALTYLQVTGAEATFTVPVYGPGVGVEPYIMSVTGNLTVATGKSRIYLEGNYVVERIRASVNTAPTGSSIIVDVNKNGTTLFTDQGVRPAIAISNNTAISTPAVTTFALGDYITVDVDQIGSTVAGADLTVVIRLRRTA